MKKAKKFIVKGRVQGVGYRYFTQHVANRIGIYGYVRNLYDGSVEVYAIGTEQQLINLKKLLLQGPSFSKVEEIIENETDINNNCISFKITY